jgi:hypothetical protein
MQSPQISPGKDLFISTKIKNLIHIPAYKQFRQALITELRKSDDQVFAEIESKRIEKKIDKENSKRLKVWESYERNQHDDINIRKKIAELKTEIRNSPSNSLEKMNKYFTQEHR